MQPQEFVNKWKDTILNETQVAQAHFLDVCRLVSVEMPGGAGKTPRGETFVFEQSLSTAGGHGFADVYYENHFAIEYKSPDKYKDLNAAYQQLLKYRENLNNPPLLAVTDINNWEIHTNFSRTEKRVYKFNHAQIASDPEKLALLRKMFHDPESLNPGRNTEQVTKEAAKSFEVIADNMRDWDAEPTRIAYFLTKLVFCLFAEDIGLLPRVRDTPDGIFRDIIKLSKGRPRTFQRHLQNLFNEMNRGGEYFGEDIKYFNGTLFSVVTVEELSLEAMGALAEAAKLNWESIEPSIFGTLFERSLDPSKRAQLGAHYTSREDILLIVEPVLMQPLRYEWDTVQLEAAPVRDRLDNAQTGRGRANARNKLLELRERILSRIRETTVLDPACGSGNFLYVALQELMDLEKRVIQHPLWSGLQMPAPAVHPRQLFGIEKAPIAHALASIVVWIGYIQWRINNGHGQSFGDPILEKLQGNIVCKDAILPPPPVPNAVRANDDSRGVSAKRHRDEAVEWPAVDVIVGNPPFLGGKKMRGELGDEYVDRLREYYKDRLPGFTDLVTYWFEKSREQIEKSKVRRVGLLATNSIGMGTNLSVMKRIKATGDIFMAWSDRPWLLDGAAVRVSMVGFDNGSESRRVLDGVPVSEISPDLKADVDITVAEPLEANFDLSFVGVQKSGPFDISASKAAEFLSSTNDAGFDNADVVRPFANGTDITGRPRGVWIVDFGPHMSLEVAKRYELPYKYVEENILPIRKKVRRAAHRKRWWIHGDARPGMRTAIHSLSRFITTPLVSTHRVFEWFDKSMLPSNLVVAIARDDDYFMGILHSRIHEVWSLRMGTTLGAGPRYTNSTTFETFPFPWSPGREDESQPAHAAISAAAKQLHEERHNWLNPPDESAKELKERTLTNLYNALQVWRSKDTMKTKAAAREFAPRLDELHRALDEAVCDAYGWEVGVLDDEEEILRRLLALNLARAAT